MMTKVIVSDMKFVKKKDYAETLCKYMEMIYEFTHKWSLDCSRIVIFESIMSIAQSNKSVKNVAMS